MAPYPQIHSRDTSVDDSPQSNRITPVVIAGIAFSGALILAVCLWLGIRTWRKRSREQRADGRQGAFLTVKGLISEDDEKAAPPRIAISGPGPFSREQLTASIVMPHRNIVRPDATRDDILRFHMTTGTMTRPFSNAASSTLAPSSPGAPARPISTVSYLSAPDAALRRSSFFGFGNGRPISTASSTYSAASTILGVEGRKVRQLFSPVLPDELVLSLSEKVTVVQSFDDGWCIVGRDSLVKPGEVEMGAVPAWCFVKPVKGLKASRPMRTTSLGVTVQLDAGPGFSSRDELISWSNF
ncbi:hypothetical protein H4582DRAFT_1549366 [Lactarius indigo]|nr:hypothetical protein H4582DRAFT_1549366 [Lactarius indigo]